MSKLKQRGEVATFLTLASLVVMAAGFVAGNLFSNPLSTSSSAASKKAFFEECALSGNDCGAGLVCFQTLSKKELDILPPDQKTKATQTGRCISITTIGNNCQGLTDKKSCYSQKSNSFNTQAVTSGPITDPTCFKICNPGSDCGNGYNCRYTSTSAFPLQDKLNWKCVPMGRPEACGANRTKECLCSTTSVTPTQDKLFPPTPYHPEVQATTPEVGTRFNTFGNVCYGNFSITSDPTVYKVDVLRIDPTTGKVKEPKDVLFSVADPTFPLPINLANKPKGITITWGSQKEGRYQDLIIRYNSNIADPRDGTHRFPLPATITGSEDLMIRIYYIAKLGGNLKNYYQDVVGKKGCAPPITPTNTITPTFTLTPTPTGKAPTITVTPTVTKTPTPTKKPLSCYAETCDPDNDLCPAPLACKNICDYTGCDSWIYKCVNPICGGEIDCTCDQGPTLTPKTTVTPTRTPTITPTKTPTNTPTKTPTSTPTKTPTLTPTLTNTPTPTSRPLACNDICDPSSTATNNGCPTNLKCEPEDGTGIPPNATYRCFLPGFDKQQYQCVPPGSTITLTPTPTTNVCVSGRQCSNNHQICGVGGVCVANETCVCNPTSTLTPTPSPKISDCPQGNIVLVVDTTTTTQVQNKLEEIKRTLTEISDRAQYRLYAFNTDFKEITPGRFVSAADLRSTYVKQLAWTPGTNISKAVLGLRQVYDTLSVRAHFIFISDGLISRNLSNSCTYGDTVEMSRIFPPAAKSSKFSENCSKSSYAEPVNEMVGIVHRELGFSPESSYTDNAAYPFPRVHSLVVAAGGKDSFNRDIMDVIRRHGIGGQKLDLLTDPFGSTTTVKCPPPFGQLTPNQCKLNTLIEQVYTQTCEPKPPIQPQAYQIDIGIVNNEGNNFIGGNDLCFTVAGDDNSSATKGERHSGPGTNNHCIGGGMSNYLIRTPGGPVRNLSTKYKNMTKVPQRIGFQLNRCLGKWDKTDPIECNQALDISGGAQRVINTLSLLAPGEEIQVHWNDSAIKNYATITRRNASGVPIRECDYGEKAPNPCDSRSISSTTTSTKIVASEDTYVSSSRDPSITNRPDFKGGKSEGVFIGHNPNARFNLGKTSTLLNFDLSNIPQNKIVLSANLHLFSLFSSFQNTPDETMVIDLFEVIDQWTELDTVFRESPKHDLTPFASYVMNARTNGYKTIPIPIEKLKTWVEKGNRFEGVLISPKNSSEQFERNIASRENTTDKQPFLEINFADQSGIATAGFGSNIDMSKSQLMTFSVDSKSTPLTTSITPVTKAKKTSFKVFNSSVKSISAVNFEVCLPDGSNCQKLNNQTTLNAGERGHFNTKIQTLANISKTALLKCSISFSDGSKKTCKEKVFDLSIPSAVSIMSDESGNTNDDQIEPEIIPYYVDINDDGECNTLDYGAVIVASVATDPNLDISKVDVNEDGVVDSLDFSLAYTCLGFQRSEVPTSAPLE